MLRTTISKLRQVCALTFVPRLLRGDFRYTPDRFERLSLCVQRRVDKSTSSSKQDNDDCERCQRIIDRAFAPPTEDVEIHARPKESFMSMITPEVPTPPENQCEKCQRIINQIFGEENAGDRKRDTVDPVRIPLTELQATTAKENAETLAQKIERIDETPLVEAPARQKLEGFNVQPKVLGTRKKRRIGERISVLHYSNDKSAHGRKKGGLRRDGSFDELAKRCLDSPSSHIDERLLKEMEKLGVPPSSRRGTRRTANDAGIVQPDIMKRPRRPVAKTELDFLMMRRARLLRLNSDLPPPFELTPSKANSINLVAFTEADDSLLRYERIPPLKDQILSDVVAMSDDAEVESVNPLFEDREQFIRAENRPPQQLLGQMTATVMSDESNVMTGRQSETEHVVDRQEHGEYKEGTICPTSGVVFTEHDNEHISLERFREMEEQERGLPQDKFASTHILSELVDPKEISPRAHNKGMLNEEIDMLKNLLRTRVEYLTQERIKRLHPVGDPNSMPKETTQEVERVVMKEFTESEVDDTLQQLGVDNFKHEKVKSHHLKEDLNIISKETSPFTEPGVVVKQCTEAQPLRETDPTLLRSYSQKHEFVTPHQVFEELSLISRETEIGVIMDDLSETVTHTTMAKTQEPRNTAPKGSIPGQLIDNMGVVSKESTDGPTATKGPHITLTEKYQPLIDSYAPKHRDIPKFIQEENKLQHMVNVSNESKPFEEDTEEPVIASEMGRLTPIPDNDLETNNNFVNVSREPVLHAVSDANAMPSTNEITQETVLHPLLDRGAVAGVAAQKLNESMPHEATEMPGDVHSVTMPKKRDDKAIPLSELLKRVRERNRMQFCKQYEVRMAGPEVDPLVGECGKKQPPCPPPAKTCPPPPPKPCPPTKPPCPNPCKPKCPPTCPPTPCEPKPKCPPPKKSPCEKFQKAKCSSVKIQDALTLLLYLGPQFHIPQKSLLPFLTCAFNSLSNPSTDAVQLDRVFTSLHNLCTLFLVASMRNEIDTLESVVTGKDYAKTYDPWIPIPSWPIPVREEKRKLVCPKDGCKVAPPKLNPPCRDINPCLNFPKKHFSILDYLAEALWIQKVVYDIEDF